MKSLISKKFIAILGCVSVLVLSMSGCGKSTGSEDFSIPKHDKNPVVTITMSDNSVMTLELYPDIAPISVCNFIYLANSGFYDGMIFHRVIENFVIQAGDANQVGASDPNYTIKGEFASNGVENTISHEPGTLSMARATANDSASTQFFICCGDATFLDGDYAGFGKICDEESFETLYKLGSVTTDAMDKPLTDLVIKSCNVNTFGVNYPKPPVVSGSLE